MTFQELNDKLQGRNKYSKKVGNNTYAIRNDDGSIGIRLHNTQVVVFYAQGGVRFFTGGWHTVTTKARINEFAPKPWGVFQRKGEWFVWNYETREEFKFVEGFELSKLSGRDPYIGSLEEELYNDREA